MTAATLATRDEGSLDSSTVASPTVLMDAVEARACVNAINQATDITDALVLELEEREGWRALGYPSWRACAAAELNRSVATVYRILDRARVERNLGFSHSEKRLPLLAAGDLARVSVDDQRAVADKIDLTTAPRRQVQELVRAGKDAQVELARRGATAVQERRRLSVEALPTAPPVSPSFRMYRSDNRQVLPTLPTDGVQLVITSPGYAVRWRYGDNGASDDVSPDEKMAELIDVLPKIARVLGTGGVLVLNLPVSIRPRAHPVRAWPLSGKVQSWLCDEGAKHGLLLRETINWQRQDAHGRPLAEGTAIGAPSNWFARRTREDLLIVSKDTYAIAGKHSWPVGYDYLDLCKDTWCVGPGHAQPGGPLAFPDELVRRLVELFSEPDDIVLDPYAGTGTVGRVARELGRAAWLIEREPSYWPELEALAAA